MMIVLAFVATYFLKINLIYIILVCGAIGGASEYMHKKVVVADETIAEQEETIEKLEDKIEDLEEQIEEMSENEENENNGGKN